MSDLTQPIAPRIELTEAQLRQNKRALALLFSANTVSALAQGISLLAIPWYFASVIGRADFFAVGYAVITMLSIPWSLYAGTLVDKYSRQKMFMTLCLTGIVVLGLAATLGFINEGVPPLVALLVFGYTIFNFNVHYPTMYGFVQEITPPASYGKVVSAIEIQGQGTNIISGLLAALLLEGGASLSFIEWLPVLPKWSLAEVFAFDAGTYVLAFALVGSIRYFPIKTRFREGGNAWARLQTGLRFLRERPALARFGALSYVLFAVLLVEVNVLLPEYSKNWLNGDARTFAIAEASYAFGAFSAGVFIRRLFQGWSERRAIVLLYVAIAIGLTGAALMRSEFYLYGMSVLLGLCNAGTRVLRVSYLFARVGNEVIGRTNSAFTVFNIVLRTTFIGLLALPFFYQNGNIRWGFMGFGVVLMGVAYVLWRGRGIQADSKAPA